MFRKLLISFVKFLNILKKLYLPHIYQFIIAYKFRRTDVHQIYEIIYRYYLIIIILISYTMYEMNDII